MDPDLATQLPHLLRFVAVFLVVILPIVLLGYRFARRLGVPLCRQCDDKRHMVRFSALSGEQQAAVRMTYESARVTVGDWERVGLCTRCRVIAYGFSEARAAWCTRCGGGLQLRKDGQGELQLFCGHCAAIRVLRFDERTQLGLVVMVDAT